MITIITPCLNRSTMVQEAIESVLHQDYPYVEHIIMDGGSTDGTLEVLARYPLLRVISQEDNGLYDAINQGIKLAKGELVGILNTDDHYEPNVFHAITEIFSRSPEIQAVSGGSVVFRVVPDGSREILVRHASIQVTNLIVRATLQESSFNAWFFRKEVFKTLGLLDTQYRLLADRDFLIRFALKQIRFTSLDQVVYHYQQHPEALTFNDLNLSEERLGMEACLIAEHYLKDRMTDHNQEEILKAWHTRITIEQAISAMKRKSLPATARYFKRGLGWDIRWPIKFIRQIPSRGLKYTLKQMSK